MKKILRFAFVACVTTQASSHILGIYDYSPLKIGIIAGIASIF